MGPFNNYVDSKGWVGGQANVYASKVNDLFLVTLFVYERWVGGPKSTKICLRSYWMPPNSTCPWGGSGSSGHSFSGLIHDIPQAPSHKQSFLSFKQSLSVLHFRGHGLFLPFFSSWTDSVCLGGHSSGFVNPWVLDVDLRLRKWSEKS